MNTKPSENENSNSEMKSDIKHPQIKINIKNLQVLAQERTLPPQDSNSDLREKNKDWSSKRKREKICR